MRRAMSATMVWPRQIISPGYLQISPSKIEIGIHGVNFSRDEAHSLFYLGTSIIYSTINPMIAVALFNTLHIAENKLALKQVKDINIDGLALPAITQTEQAIKRMEQEVIMKKQGQPLPISFIGSVPSNLVQGDSINASRLKHSQNSKPS